VRERVKKARDHFQNHQFAPALTNRAPMRTAIGSWAFDDPYAAIPLVDIPRVVDRALSHLARHADPSLSTEGFMTIRGAITMIGGMEYHHDNFLDWVTAIQSGDHYGTDPLIHEAVAYLNRMGQFAAFVRSTFAKRAVRDFRTATPTIARLLVFRNKHSAHRSLDVPQSEPAETRIYQELGMWGNLFSPRPGARPIHFEDGEVVDMRAHRKFMFTDYHMTFQMIDHKTGGAEQFNMELDHPTIMTEAYSVIERVVSAR
jgi:hypothetical protein